MAAAAVAASAGGELGVLGAELPPGAVGQVEVAEHLVSDPDRHPQETRHRRVPGGNPDERGSSPMRPSRIG